MLKKIGLIVLATLAIILGLAAMQPSAYSIKREVAIKAGPEKIMPLLADFKQWPAWSPWEKKDPAMKRTLSGADSGKGAQYGWEGNGEVGSGRMEIVDVTDRRLEIKLDFLGAMASTNKTEFVLTPNGDGTTVTWTMSGPMNFLSKIMCVFFDMDAMIGPDFEKGLQNLKAAAEK
jgi:uncharacterized protein YndB with AHSA1/START domain